MKNSLSFIGLSSRNRRSLFSSDYKNMITLFFFTLECLLMTSNMINIIYII